MPKGPKGQKRPADVIGNAVRVMQVATGEVDESSSAAIRNVSAVELGRLGGQARAQALSKEKRAEIAANAAKTRWAKKGQRGLDRRK